MAEKVRSTTIQQRFGFKDDDLISPKHDDIMIWLQENIKGISFEILSSVYSKMIELGHFDPDRLKITWECPVMASNGFMVGFIDMRVIAASISTFFEVKTTIRSAGELIRQLRMYQAYGSSSSDIFVVVSPDDKFAEILMGQGILFVRYPDRKIFS